MITWLMIGLGGALGAMSRHAVSVGMALLLGPRFPMGTLIVNVLGSLLMGLLVILLMDKVAFNQARAFLLIGFLGAFTTFSSFSIETFNLYSEQSFIMASLNILLNVVLCLVAVSVGIWLGRQI